MRQRIETARWLKQKQLILIRDSYVNLKGPGL
jgi:hypothetical protein